MTPAVLLQGERRLNNIDKYIIDPLLGPNDNMPIAHW